MHQALAIINPLYSQKNLIHVFAYHYDEIYHEILKLDTADQFRQNKLNVLC